MSRKIEPIICVYSIKNNNNGFSYIGGTLNFRSRVRSHIYNLNKNKHPTLLLQNDWIIHGQSNFAFEIIEKVDNADLLIDREQYYLDNTPFKYNTRHWASNNSANPLRVKKPNKPIVWITTHCVICGNEVRRTTAHLENRPNPTCSRLCINELNKRIFSVDNIEKPCSYCGVIISRKPSEFRDKNACYCSKSCICSATHNGPSKIDTRPCTQCGVNVTRKSRYFGKHIFCSSKCKSQFHR